MPLSRLNSFIKNCVFFLLSLFCLISCTTKSSNSTLPFKIRVDASTGLLPISSIDSVIVLDTTGSIFLSYEIIARPFKNSFLIMEAFEPKYLVRFTPNEKPKLVVEVGQAPGNLPGITAFSAFKDSLEVLFTVGDESFVYSLSEGGDVMTKKNFNHLATNFARISQTTHALYTSYNLPLEKNRLIGRDISGMEKWLALPSSYSGTKVPIFEKNFHLNPTGSTFFTETFGYTVYNITKEGVVPVVVLEDGPKHLPNDFWEKSILDQFEKMLESGFYTIMSSFESKSHILVEARFQSAEKNYVVIFLINKSTQKSVKAVFDFNYREPFAFPIGFTENGEIMFLANPKFLKEKSVHLSVKPNAARILASRKWKEDENPVIAICSVEF